MDFMTEDIIRYKRQIYQRLLRPPLPPGNILKDPEVQAILYRDIFNHRIACDLGEVYLKKELERLTEAITRSVKDPHEEGVLDELYQVLAELAQSAASSDPLQKRLVRYHAPTDYRSSEQYIQILEKPQVIGSGSDTGNRTWEASLRLMHYLYANSHLIRGRKVLELGAGSGLLSIFCAAVLGADAVIATDGSPQILQALEQNVELNASLWTDDTKPPVTQLLDFHDDLVPFVKSRISYHDVPCRPDIIIGADLTYDDDLARSLGRNLRATADSVKTVDTILVATQRNTNTLAIFEQEFIRVDDGDARKTAAKGSSPYEKLGFQVPGIQDQKGLFHTLATEISIYAHLHLDHSAKRI